MQKISPTSCYYYYGQQWENWDQLRENFSWELPEKMNAAFLRATVQSVTYLGSVVRYRVGIKNNNFENVALNVETPGSQIIYEPGEQVSLNIRIEDIHLFR